MADPRRRHGSTPTPSGPCSRPTTSAGWCRSRSTSRWRARPAGRTPRSPGPPPSSSATTCGRARPGSPHAFATGATEAGADVVMIGLASTDMLYFASGHLGVPGAMFTASHNPAQYNGIKLCRANAVPLGLESGLDEIRDLVIAPRRDRRGRPARSAPSTSSTAYAAHLLSLVPMTGSRALKVVVDAGNGMAGHTAPAVFERLPEGLVELVPMYFELDGTFPHHEANPIEPANLRDLQDRVVREGADLGLAFDGDADRCFLVDERGAAVSPVGAHRADRQPRAGQGAGRDGDPQPDHQPRRARAGPRARRRPGPHPRRPLLHQGDDGRDRRDLRRRAQRPLLLPRLLARRLRDARGAARARRALRDRPAAVGADGRVRPLPAQRRDQLRGRRHRRRSPRRSPRRTPAGRASPSTGSTG